MATSEPRSDKQKTKQTESKKEDKEKKERLNRREAIESAIVAILGIFWLPIIFEPLALGFGIKAMVSSTDRITTAVALIAIIISLITLGIMLMGILFIALASL